MMKTIHKRTKEDLVNATEMLLINAALNAAGGQGGRGALRVARAQ